MSSAPIRNGWIDVEAGRVVALGPPAERMQAALDLGTVAVLPGLVNAHTHLELTSLRGAVPPAVAVPDWVRRLMAVRRGTEVDTGAIRRATKEARASGTSLVGDVSNTLATVDALRDSPLGGVVFYEILAFNPSDPAQLARTAAASVSAREQCDRVRVRLAAHAPYSVSPALFAALWIEIEAHHWTPFGLHLAESCEERELLMAATGKWRSLLEDLGVWNAGWRPPACDPVEYIDRLGWLRPGLVAAHGVQLTGEELRRLAAADATIVTCPRSNAWTGAGAPPVARFYASGVRVAVGTDSLTSCPDLNLFAELAELRRLAPSVSARRLLASATLEGSAALGFGTEYGCIAPGCRADLIAVSIPDHVSDVEEYLVGGIAPRQIAWLPS